MSKVSDKMLTEVSVLSLAWIFSSPTTTGRTVFSINLNNTKTVLCQLSLPEGNQQIGSYL